MGGNWDAWLDERRAELVERRLLRRPHPIRPKDSLHGEISGREVVLFASNDYLGLSTHPAVRAAAADAAARLGMGPRGAALLCGTTALHEELERELARLSGTEAALLTPTGYAANLSVLSALAGPDTAIFSDERNHASIIDGCRLARERGAEVHVYRHADPEHLEALISGSGASRRLIVTDTVFSMDGDLAPLPALAEIRNRHDALLVADEAHAMLVLGDSGGGAAEALGVREDVDIHVGTLGKAIGAHGGFIAASARTREHFISSGRPYVYSTALPVPVVAAARAALDAFRADPGLRERLRTHTATLGHALGIDPPSPIVKVVIGDEEEALRASRELLERGCYLPAIRPPTVPAGSSRLRITLSAGHTAEEITMLIEALRALGLT